MVKRSRGDVMSAGSASPINIFQTRNELGKFPLFFVPSRGSLVEIFRTMGNNET